MKPPAHSGDQGAVNEGGQFVWTLLLNFAFWAFAQHWILCEETLELAV
jgi:hypothetical protein